MGSPFSNYIPHLLLINSKFLYGEFGTHLHQFSHGTILHMKEKLLYFPLLLTSGMTKFSICSKLTENTWGNRK